MSSAASNNWRTSPLLVRVLPFGVFVALTACQGAFGEASRYWFYALKTLVGVWLIFQIRPWVQEMRWNFSGWAVAAGVGVFLIWVGLDGAYPSMDRLLRMVLSPLARPLGFGRWADSAVEPAHPWNPLTQFAPGLAWTFAILRLLGSSLVVPPLEEVFYRSFVYRYLVRPEFDQVPLNCFRWGPFLITSTVFGLAHYEWLPGILCGMIYQGLVLRTNRLGDAMAAHGITNFLLGVWVLWKGAWHFW